MSHVAANDAVEREHLSPHEFVLQTGLSLSTVRRYLDSGRLPFVQPGGPGCRVLIPRTALDCFFATKLRPPKSDTIRSHHVAMASVPQHKSLPGPKAKWRSQH